MHTNNNEPGDLKKIVQLDDDLPERQPKKVEKAKYGHVDVDKVIGIITLEDVMEELLQIKYQYMHLYIVNLYIVECLYTQKLKPMFAKIWASNGPQQQRINMLYLKPNSYGIWWNITRRDCKQNK